MKKLVVFSALFVLAAGASFAQLANGIWINAWGRGAFVPLWYEGKIWEYGEFKPNINNFINKPVFKTGTGVTWDPNNQSRVDFRVNGATDWVGFTVHVNSEYLEGTGNGDNGAQLWVKPFGNNWLKLTVANHFIDDTLRGKVTTDTGFENFVYGKSMLSLGNEREPLNQDVTFNRFGGGRGSVSAANLANTSTWISDQAMLSNVFFLSSSPIDGLFIGLMLQGIFPDTDLKESWRQVHIGAGYQIPNIGHARVQYIGGFMGKEKTVTDMFRYDEPSKFEAAFAYTGMENLLVDLGAKIWMPVTTASDRTNAPDTTHYRGLDIGLGATYRYNDFNIAFMMQALYLGAYTSSRARSPHDTVDMGNDGAHLVFNIIPEYDFDFGTVGLSFILQTKLAEKDTNNAGEIIENTPWTRFGAGVWYRKGFAGGSIKTGVAYSLPAITTGPLPTLEFDAQGRPIPRGEGTGFNGRGVLTIPIILEYAFF